MLIIPQPAIFDKIKGSFTLDKTLKIYADCAEYLEGISKILNVFQDAEYVEEGYNVSIKQSKNLEFEYSIRIMPDLIDIEYTSEVTLFYAITTLKQLMFDSNEIACCNIFDKHRYDYRGLMVDTNKRFISVEYLKKLADIMACYKLNKLHIRFNDNIFFGNGKNSNSQNVADISSEKENNETNKTGDDREESFNFSTENLKELVKYCGSRYIEIIPEIDLSACVEKLADNGKRDATESQKEEVEIIEYCKEYIVKFAEIFSSKLIHIGFESVSEKVWKNSDACKDKMAEMGIKKIAKVIEYFWEEVAKIAESYGKKIVLFGNDIKAKPPKGAVLQWLYNDFKKTICGRWMKRGGNCIISCATYFNLSSGYIKLPLAKIYSFDMMFVGVPINYRKFVLGYECCYDSKKGNCIDKMESLLFPRLIAFAEKGWTTHSLLYTNFKERLVTHNKFLSDKNINYTSIKEANPNIFKRATAYIFIMQNRIKKVKSKDIR